MLLTIFTHASASDVTRPTRCAIRLTKSRTDSDGRRETVHLASMKKKREGSLCGNADRKNQTPRFN